MGQGKSKKQEEDSTRIFFWSVIAFWVIFIGIAIFEFFKDKDL